MFIIIYIYIIYTEYNTLIYTKKNMYKLLNQNINILRNY